MTANPSTLKFVCSNRRVREDRRFVVGGGRYVADIVLDEMLHVALAPSQHPAARIINIDSFFFFFFFFFFSVDPLMNGLDTPKVKRYPLAVGQARYAGEWVAAVVAETRAQAEDALDAIRIDYEPLPYVVDAEEAITDAKARTCTPSMEPTFCSTRRSCGVMSKSTLLKVQAISRFA